MIERQRLKNVVIVLQTIAVIVLHYLELIKLQPEYEVLIL